MLCFSTASKRTISQCNFNYSSEGILHPDRVMDEYDFLFLQKGAWDIIEDDVTYPLREGQLLILEPGKHHFSLEKCTPHMRNMYLHCTVLPQDASLAVLPQSYTGIAVGKLTDCNQNPKVPLLFQTIIEEYWNRPDAHQGTRLSALFELLLCELASCGMQQSTEDALVTELRQLFLTNSDRFFHTEELSRRFGLSSHTIGARFKEATGTTLYQYQLTLKLNMIHELLPQNPNRGLRDIALSFGFYDEFQFSRLFKRQFGCSPSIRRLGSGRS